MISIQICIIIIACLASVACVLPGVFLVLRGVALMSDAISHAILFGIAVMFLIVQRLESPLLIVGASLAGLFTVVCTEALIAVRSLKKDAAIGIVFPLLFSIGVLLISKFARNVHLDTDMILLGEITFAPFNRLIIFGYDIGPYAIWLLSLIVVLNGLFVMLCYKELKLVTFDQDYAKIANFRPLVLYYCLMSLTSITAVAAFDIVGAIVVVALMITPPATAYLITNSLSAMIWMSITFGFASSIVGYWVAHFFDVSIAGCIASMTGFFFLIALFFSPIKGIFAYILMQRKYKVEICKKILCHYLAQQGMQGRRQYCSVANIAEVFKWPIKFLNILIKRAENEQNIYKKNGILFLTKKGYEEIKS